MWSIDRLAGTRFPVSRQVMTLSPYSHRQFAVARLMSSFQQIGFQAVRFASNQTSLASCGSSHEGGSVFGGGRRSQCDWAGRASLSRVNKAKIVPVDDKFVALQKGHDLPLIPRAAEGDGAARLQAHRHLRRTLAFAHKKHPEHDLAKPSVTPEPHWRVGEMRKGGARAIF